MVEVPLSELSHWYEENVSKTSTLAIVRRVVQGSFPDVPWSKVLSLGHSWSKFESLREELGDFEFELFLQCQMEDYKRYRKSSRFYISYLVDQKSEERWEKHQARIRSVGYHSLRSEIFRSCFPHECAALQKYFLRWLLLSDETEPRPDWSTVKIEQAPEASPLWVFFTLTQDQAKEHGRAIHELWMAAKKLVHCQKLFQDRNEYTRACLEALRLVATQITPEAYEFTILPLDEEFSWPFQVAVQLYDLRPKLLKRIGALHFAFGDPRVGDR